MKHIPQALLFTLLLTSCFHSYDIAYEVDTCVKEIDNRYAATGRMPSSIYRVDDIVINEKSNEPEIKVSSWSHSQWFYEGKKHHGYFENSKLFSYKPVECPVKFGEKYRKKNIGIDKRIKKIDI